jgi:DNA-binding transcriptional LysR family regulator
MRYFTTVAEEGNIVRAARKLRVAQPALSRQIQHLEREVGVSLFERERRGVRLTDAGSALLNGTRGLLARVEEAQRRTQLAHEGRLGTLRLALGRVAVQSSRVARGLAAIRERFPDIQLVVSELPSIAQEQSLRMGEIDLAIGIEGGDEKISKARQTLYADVIDHALLPATHALAKESRLDPRQLKGERLLMLAQPKAPGFSELFESLRRLGFGEWEDCESPETVYGLVAAGRGWTTHVSSVKSYPRGTVAIPLTGLRVPVTVVLRWNESDTSRLTSNVVALFRSIDEKPASAPAATKRRETPRTDRQAARVRAEFELRQLRSYVVTAEEGSLSRAAPRLGLTQSGLSRQLRALERPFGFPLLRRIANGVALTSAGQVFRAEAQEVLALADVVVTSARRADRGITGGCIVGAVPSEFTRGLLYGVLNQARDWTPEISVEVREMLTASQVPALRAREIDIGIAAAFTGMVDDGSIASARLVEDEVDCALLSATHPLAARACLRPSDLASVPFLFISRAAYPKLYDTVLQAFGEIGLIPQISSSEFNGPRTVWGLVADGLGWTLGTRSLREHSIPGLVALPIEGLHISGGIDLLWRRDETDPSVLTVLEAFRGASASAGTP